jgi:hypothetical protein
MEMQQLAREAFKYGSCGASGVHVQTLDLTGKVGRFLSIPIIAGGRLQDRLQNTLQNRLQIRLQWVKKDWYSALQNERRHWLARFGRVGITEALK